MIAPVHFNDELPTAVAILTTREGELLEVAALPLNANFEPSQESRFRFYHRKLKPKTPTSATASHARHGDDPHIAGDLFVQWFDRLGLNRGKQLVAIAHHWDQEREIVREWLGPLNFDYCFSTEYRDSFVASRFINDSVGAHLDLAPFPNEGLKAFVERFGIEVGAKSAIDRARQTAETYRQLLLRYAYNLPPVKPNEEANRWRAYAAFCKSCALSGEQPLSIEDFERTLNATE